MSGLDLKYGDRLNVIWVAEASPEGRAAKTLFDLPERGVALLGRDNRLVWHAAGGTRQRVEAQLLQVLEKD